MIPIDETLFLFIQRKKNCMSIYKFVNEHIIMKPRNKKKYVNINKKFLSFREIFIPPH